MATVRIPELTPAIGIDGTELVEIAVATGDPVVPYVSRRVTTGAIAGAGLPSGVTPGTYGDSTHVGQFTVDVFGRLTAAQNVVIGTGGIGTVTSVAMTVPTGLSVTGSPITTNGTLAVTWTSGTTGTGANVFATSPALVTPDLGTPSAAVLTNATGLPISSGVSGLGTGVATFLGTPSSANLAAAVTDETGTGSLVFATNPVLVTPNLGTPSAGVLTNATGLPITGGTTGTLAETRGGTNQTTYTTGDLLYASGANTLAKRGIGTNGDVLTVSGGIPTWVAPGSGGTVTSVSVVTANGFAGSVVSPTATPAITISTTITGILQGNGTAISAASTTGSGNVVLATGPVIDLTNATGLPIAGITGLGSGVGTWLATPSSANLAAAVTDETGSGALVFANTPTLVTPVLGVATATSINKVTITAPATSATLTIPDGVTMTGPATSGTVMTLGNAETVTGIKTFNNNKLLLGGSTSGMVTLNAAAIAGTTTATFPAITGNVSIIAFATTATAGGTTTLTSASAPVQEFTGTQNQTVVLPVTSTLIQGQPYTIINNSTGVVTVQSSGANAVVTVPPGSTTAVTCILTSGTTAASWSYIQPIKPQSFYGLVRNRIVNPAMQISQENGNASGTTTGYYAADQWAKYMVTSAGVFTAQRVQSRTPQGSLDRFRVTITTQDASLAAGEYCTINQNIEGQEVADFQYGLSTAKQAVLRFGWKSPAGTYSVSIKNSALNRSYVAQFTPTAANTDEYISLVIPGDVTGTWLTTTGIGLSLDFTIAAGSTFQAAGAGWSAGNFLGLASNTNGVASAAAVFELFDVQLCLDPDNTGVAPAWELPDVGEVTQAVMRYWRPNSLIRGIWISTTAFAGTTELSPPMRIKPNGSIISGAPAAEIAGVADYTISSITSVNGDVSGIDVRVVTATATNGATGYILSSSIALNARM